MTFQETDYSPKLHNWFSPNIEYVGLGTAKFTQPSGTLQGHTHVQYDELGSCKIRMTVDKITFDDIEISDVSSRLPFFFAGIESGIRNRQWGVVPQVRRNPCASLSVTTLEGTFIATDLGTNYEPAEHFLSNSTKIIFSPLQAIFETKFPASPFYFVAPLTNFLNSSGWSTHYHPAIVHHPLRMWVSPTIPDDLAPEENQRAYFQQLSALNVIGFLFQDEPAFIEPLNDYSEREARLKEEDDKCLITAIMVGSVAQKEITLLNWESLGYRDLLPLLSLSTGSYVGSPWIEIRASNGKLVQRIHTNLVSGQYKPGIGALGHSVNRGGLGHLLSMAQKSVDFGKPYLRATISQIVMGGYFNSDGNIEDRMSHLYRALDRLCGEHIPWERKFSLSDKNRGKLKRIMKDFTKSIEGLSVLTPSSDDQAQREAEELKRIVETIRAVTSSTIGFSTRIEQLLENFGLDDGKVLDEYYEINPGADNATKWSKVIVYYRNKIMHSAWFDWESKKLNNMELIAVTFHLHDILVRLVLILLQYDGEYEPSILQLRGLAKEILWVQKSITTPKELGYEQSNID